MRLVHSVRLLLLAAMLSLVTAGCSTSSSPATWQRSEVYFGLSRPDGSLISGPEWQVFLDEVITPEFPAGLSVIDVTGQWRNATGHIDHEATKMLVLLHPADPAIVARLDRIRQAYCERFGQEVVLMVTTRARVAF